jgi:sulfite oxidase
MNCRWRGPRLRDVLLKAGVRQRDKPGYIGTDKGHVAFSCFQTKCQDDHWYGASIELERAMNGNGEVILALEMNGKQLHPNHGFPVRVIVPGVAGARCVKWLDEITIQLKESQNYYQTKDYKVLPPEAVDRKAAEKFWDSTPAIQDMPINSVIARPLSESKVALSEKGTIVVQGYALPHGDQGPVIKVEVSVDEGKSWVAADIVAGKGLKWCWVLWKAEVEVKKGKRRVLSRATDTGGNVQAKCPVWNLRGVCYNGYGEARDLEIL